MNTVKTMAREAQEELKSRLLQIGGTCDTPPLGAAFQVRGEDWIVTAYNSGKVLFQGRRTDVPLAIAGTQGMHKSCAAQTMPFPVVGGDESGKGDMFGPLAVCAFAARTPQERAATVAAGARDCKLMSDGEVHSVATKLKKIGMFQVVVLMPEQYNIRYRRSKNVNVLLNELYADMLLKLARECEARTVILDKYGSRATSLWKEEHHFRFVVEERAERYVEVAAASVLARDAFLTGLEDAAHQYGLDILPKGSSTEAQTALAGLVRQRGEGILPHVAKMHFAPIRASVGDLFARR